MPTTSKYFLHCKKKKKSQDWKQESRWVVYDTAAASGRVSCFYSWLWKRVVLQDNVRRLVHRGFEIIQGGNQKVLSPVWFWREKMKNVFTGRWWQWSSGTLVVSESAGNRNKACSTLLKTFLFYLRFVFAYFIPFWPNWEGTDQTFGRICSDFSSWFYCLTSWPSQEESEGQKDTRREHQDQSGQNGVGETKTTRLFIASFFLTVTSEVKV